MSDLPSIQLGKQGTPHPFMKKKKRTMLCGSPRVNCPLRRNHSNPTLAQQQARSHSGLNIFSATLRLQSTEDIPAASQPSAVRPNGFRHCYQELVPKAAHSDVTKAVKCQLQQVEFSLTRTTLFLKTTPLRPGQSHIFCCFVFFLIYFA